MSEVRERLGTALFLRVAGPDGAAHADRQREHGVEEGVGDQLGDAELGALDEVVATDVTAGLDHPSACVLHAAGTRAQ